MITKRYAVSVLSLVLAGGIGAVLGAKLSGGSLSPRAVRAQVPHPVVSSDTVHWQNRETEPPIGARRLSGNDSEVYLPPLEAVAEESGDPVPRWFPVLLASDIADQYVKGVVVLPRKVDNGYVGYVVFSSGRVMGFSRLSCDCPK